jgi:hypothetical protein
MRPKKPQTTGEGDLFRARLDQIINLKHELVQLAGKIGTGIGSIARSRRSAATKAPPGIETRFVISCSSTSAAYPTMRTLGLRPVFPALHRRGVFPARIPA